MAREAGVALDAGEKVGALDAILGARFFDPQGGDSQIAIVFQGEFDEALQARVVEEIAPIESGAAATLVALVRAEVFDRPEADRRGGRSYLGIIVQPARSATTISVARLVKANDFLIARLLLCSMAPPAGEVDGGVFRLAL